MQAIVGQGEGNPNGNEIPETDQPPSNPTDPSDFDPADSHFVKFNTALQFIQTNPIDGITYPLIPNPDKQQLAEQANATIQLLQSFESFLSQLENGFNNPQPDNQMPGSFYTNMFDMQNKIAAVWQTGAIPTFTGKVYPG